MFCFAYFLQKAGNIVNFCNEAVKLNGSVPLVSKPVLVYSNTTLTAVTSTTTSIYSVVFLGTSDGFLKSVVLSSNLQANEFDSALVDKGRPILADLQIDASGQHVFAASPYKVCASSFASFSLFLNCSKSWEELAGKDK